jgi:hypothetical protein
LDARQAYPSEFYCLHRDGALRSAAVVVPLVIGMVHPSSVIDLGCGTGTWLSVFAANGVDDFLGVDGDHIERSLLDIPEANFLPFDLTRPLILDRKYDLAVSLEVAEHLPHSAADTFVESLTRASNVVLFSAAIPRQGGTGHVNEQWPDYWVERFEQKGFVAADALRPLVWNDPKVEVWYAQNSLIFVNRRNIPRYPALRTSVKATRNSYLAKVHPRLFAETARENEVHRDKGDYYYRETNRLQEEQQQQLAAMQSFRTQVIALQQAANEADARAAATLDDLGPRLAASRSMIEAAASRFAELEWALHTQRRKLELQTEEAGRLAPLIDAQGARLLAFEADVNSVKDSCRKLASDLEEATSALQFSRLAAEQLQADLRDRDLRIADQAGLQAALEQERSRLAKECDRMTAELREREARIAEQSSVRAALERDREALAAELRGRDSRLAEHTATLAKMEQGRNELSMKLDALGMELGSREAQIAEQSSTLASLDQDRTGLLVEVERLAAEVSHWKAAADLPNLPLRPLLRGLWGSIARSLRGSGT